MKKVSDRVTYEYKNNQERVEHEEKMINKGYKYIDGWLNSETESTVIYEKEF